MSLTAGVQVDFECYKEAPNIDKVLGNTPSESAPACAAGSEGDPAMSDDVTAMVEAEEKDDQSSWDTTKTAAPKHHQ